MKHKKLTIIISLLLVLSFILPLSAYGVTQSDIDKVQEERKELAERQRSSESKIEQLKEQQASVIEQKEALDERNTIAAEQLRLIQEQIALYHTMIEEKAQDVEAARETEEQQLHRLRVRVRAMEENGGYDMLSLLMNVESMSELLAAVDDINQIMEADRQLEDNYVAARQAHEQTQAEYEEMLAQLEVHEKELIEEQEELERMIAEATELIASLEEDIEQAIREYEEAERAKQAADYRISQLVAELNRQREEAKNPKPTPAPSDSETPGGSDNSGGTETPGDSETPSEPAPTSAPDPEPAPEPTPAPEDDTPDPGDSGAIGTGSLMWPVPCSHTVTSRFGYRIHPITGEEKYHSGIDIDGYGNDGGAIVACDNGTVVLAEWNGGYGNCIMIDHGNGMQTLYGHMSGYAVSYGDVVSKGDTIGYLGSTGMSTGTHCHLEVIVNGGRVDPAAYFSGITYYDC